MVVLSAAELCVVSPMDVLRSVKLSGVGPDRSLVRRWRPGNGLTVTSSPPNVDIVTSEVCLTAHPDRDELVRCRALSSRLGQSLPTPPAPNVSPGIPAHRSGTLLAQG